MTWKRWTQHIDYFFSFYGLRIRKLKGEVLRIEHRYISIEKYPVAFFVWLFFLLYLIHFTDLLLSLQILDVLKELPTLAFLCVVSYICLTFFRVKILTFGRHYFVSRLTLIPFLTFKKPTASIQKLQVSKKDYRTRYFSGWIYDISAKTHQANYHLLSIEDDLAQVEMAVKALQEHLQVPVEYPAEKVKNPASKHTQNTSPKD